MKKRKFTFGLNHGDISLRNTLVEESGKVNLLDWGCAEAHSVPHVDFIHVLSCQLKTGIPNDAQFQAFLRGYGMTRKEFRLLEPQCLELMLLVSFDKVRWAIERSPSNLKELIRKAKRILKLLRI